jgi:hypothetical protein
VPVGCASLCGDFGEVVVGFERKIGEPFEMSASWGLLILTGDASHLNDEHHPFDG